MVTTHRLDSSSTLQLRVPPDRSGMDSFGLETASCLRAAGISTSIRPLWPALLDRVLNTGRLPFGRRLFRNIVAPLYAARLCQNMNPGDVAWIQAFCVPMAKVPVFEQKLKNHAISYVFHLMDDLFDVDFLKQGTTNRCKIADLVGVPTPQLAQRVREVVPSASVEVFEEPIDLVRLDVRAKPNYFSKPVILWCGNPYNLKALQELLDILRKIRKQTAFTLRVICGQQPPRYFFDGLDMEWKKFDHATEAQLIAGSWFGLAPMANTPYNRCKGAYKVKTYLAAGLPVVASPVGFQAELVRGGHDVGLLPDSAAAWEEAVSMLIADPSRCARMGANARTYAQQRFSYSATTPSWAAKLHHHFPNLAARSSIAQ